MANASCGEEAEDGTEQKKCGGGLDRDGRAGCSARRDPVEELRSLVEEEACAEVCGDQGGDERREVRQPGEPERLWQRQLRVLLVVTRVRQPDPDEGNENPERNGGVAE